MGRTIDDARWQEVAARLEADGPCLLSQGSVVGKRVKGGTTWAVRYRVRGEGGARQRSISLGRDEGGVLRRRARALLDQFRRQGRELAQLPALVRLTSRLNALVKRRFREA